MGNENCELTGMLEKNIKGGICSTHTLPELNENLIRMNQYFHRNGSPSRFAKQLRNRLINYIKNRFWEKPQRKYLMMTPIHDHQQIKFALCSSYHSTSFAFLPPLDLYDVVSYNIYPGINDCYP